jgi:hypothetical protein
MGGRRRRKRRAVPGKRAKAPELAEAIAPAGVKLRLAQKALV